MSIRDEIDRALNRAIDRGYDLAGESALTVVAPDLHRMFPRLRRYSMDETAATVLDWQEARWPDLEWRTRNGSRNDGEAVVEAADGVEALCDLCHGEVLDGQRIYRNLDNGVVVHYAHIVRNEPVDYAVWHGVMVEHERAPFIDDGETIGYDGDPDFAPADPGGVHGAILSDGHPGQTFHEWLVALTNTTSARKKAPYNRPELGGPFARPSVGSVGPVRDV